jgi:hypothetical protein
MDGGVLRIRNTQVCAASVKFSCRSRLLALFHFDAGKQIFALCHVRARPSVVLNHVNR